MGPHRTALFWKKVTTVAYKACRVFGSAINKPSTQLNRNVPGSEVLLPRSAEPARRGAGVGNRGDRSGYESRTWRDVFASQASSEVWVPRSTPAQCRAAAVVARVRGRPSWVQGFARGKVLYHQFVRFTPKPPAPFFFFSDYRSSACLFVRKDTERQRNSKRVLDRPSLHWVVVIPEHVLISMHTGCKK